MKKVIKMLSLVLICLSLWFGWKKISADIHPRDLEVSRIDFQDKKSTLLSSDIKKDIRHLIYALENAYSGRLVYPEQYHQMISELRSLEKITHLSHEDYSRKLSLTLANMPDGHLGVTSTESEIHLSSSANRPANGNSRKVRGKNVQIMNLPSFFLPLKETGNSIIENVEREMTTADAFIFDLRGNSGGYVEIPLKISALLWGEPYRDNNQIQYFPMPIKSTGTLKNPVAFALFKNNEVLFHTKHGKRIDSETRKSFFESVLTFNEYEYGGTVKKGSYDEYNFAPISEIEENTLTYEDSQLKIRGYNRPIFIIVDSHCASACERFLEALEDHPHVKTIGNSRTMGATQFGSIGQLALPESHLIVRIPTSYITYKDGRIIEKRGYEPQIILKDNEDPYHRINSLLNN